MDYLYNCMRKPNCLIIANDIGYTAPGIVFETLLKELVNHLNIDLLSPLIKNRGAFNCCNILPAKTIIFERNRFTVSSFVLFGCNVLEHVWLYKQKKMIAEVEFEKYDVIISFISNEHYKALLLGRYLKEKYHKKWFVYSVDAIPAPLSWTNNVCYYKKTCNYISKKLTLCDALFSSNEQMLNYQVSILKGFKGVTGIIYTPIRENKNVQTYNLPKEPVILYTGSIYGPRRIDTVLDGFRLFLNDYPKAKLIFVGTKIGRLNLSKYRDLIFNANIEFHDFCMDLTPYYLNASILLDINAFFENDVFLSSKIVNYLPYKLPIVSITGLGSPTRLIFSDDSIIHSIHEPYSIFCALVKAVKCTKVDESKRQKEIRKFEVQQCVAQFVSVLNHILN